MGKRRKPTRGSRETGIKPLRWKQQRTAAAPIFRQKEKIGWGVGGCEPRAKKWERNGTSPCKTEKSGKGDVYSAALRKKTEE